ncbi:hypothetical protein [Sulfurihydrogenibium subterraneum]|uniref:hypothetical protein n=1 Tax=Sulfurihydrogenibium subterraneum TaxID=171121 RepID=UPI00048B090A|nr:hypothetical protein [Sulfurihydrogenibium subterraneum]
MKKVLDVFENIINFKEVKKDIYYCDIGYGEKFTTISMPVSNPDNLIEYSSLQLLKEIINRFLNIRMPKGFRIRVFIYSENARDYFLDFYNSSIDLNNILYNIDLKNAGSGYNYVGLYKFLHEDFKKVIKSSKSSGVDVIIKNVKTKYKPDIKTILFLIDDNYAFTDRMDKTFFTPHLINKPLAFLMDFTNRVL